MIVTLPQSVSQRSLALAYERNVLAAWRRLDALRKRRNQTIVLEGPDAPLTVLAQVIATESADYLRDLLEIRKDARKLDS